MSWRRRVVWRARMLKMRALLEGSGLLWKVGAILYHFGWHLQTRSSRMLMALLERDK